MKAITFARKTVFVLILLGGFTSAFAQTGNSDTRNTPIAVNLIVDGSASLSGVLDEVNAWIAGSMVDSLLQSGDTLTVWSAGSSAQIVYSETLQTGDEKENIKNILKSLPAQGDSADFAGALKNAASRSKSAISYTLLIKASPAALAPTLLSQDAGLVRFSRIEEFRGWRALVIGLDIDSRVRQAAAAYLSGV